MEFEDRPLQLPGAVIAGIHGHRRHAGSPLWTAVWAIFGYAMPVVAIGAAFILGFGKPKEQ